LFPELSNNNNQNRTNQTNRNQTNRNQTNRNNTGRQPTTNSNRTNSGTGLNPITWEFNNVSPLLDDGPFLVPEINFDMGDIPALIPGIGSAAAPAGTETSQTPVTHNSPAGAGVEPDNSVVADDAGLLLDPGTPPAYNNSESLYGPDMPSYNPYLD
jgi:hypothetical protein